VRVLHLTTEYPPVIYGGLGSAVGGLVRASAAAGIDVSVLIVGEGLIGGYGTGGLHCSDTFDAEPHVTVFTTPWHGAADYALQLVRSWTPDVIHLHVFWLGPIAHHLHETTGTPLVYTVHSLDLAEYEIGRGPPVCLRQWPVQRAAIADASVVIAPSRSEQELVAHYCPEVVKRLIVAGNGIDDVSVSASAAPPHEPTLLFTGRFVDRKGIRDLLEAIPLVLQATSTARFVLAGGAREATPSEIEGWWSPEALRPYRPRVRFTGWLSQDEMANYYANADVLVVPSWYEPFGMVILEAMSHGLAIAASSVGGPSEILDDGRTGLLFPPHDVQALAETLIRLANDASLRRRLGRAAFAEVRRQWLWSKKITRFLDVYELAADRSTSRQPT
jgi:glycogen(starch) synthase